MQRARLISAAALAVEDVGYQRVTVAHVIEHARVSRKTFYDVFSNCEECMVALFDSSVERARGAIQTDPAAEWQEATRSALAQILQLIEEDEGLARFCLLEAIAGGEVLVGRRTSLMGELAQLIDRGRRVAPAKHEPPPITAEGVVGAVACILQRRLCTPQSGPISGLLGPLMSIVVLPYLGESVAHKELIRPAPESEPLARREDPAPAPRPRRGAPRHDPFEGLGRLTYRTARVLSAIQEHPGASNREVGQRSGILDQGQISKLLTRLVSSQLIENRRDGIANSWHLTARGEKTEQAVRPRFGLADVESPAAPVKRRRRVLTPPR